MQRKVNIAGIALIKSFEGCRLKAYADPGSPLGRELQKVENMRKPDWQNLSGAPWTIGWGATGVDFFNLTPEGKPTPIGPGTVWTQEQCDLRKEQDLEAVCSAVEKLLKVKVNDNQFAALVSFAYNCGTNNLKNSTLLQLLNANKPRQAADEFLKWTKAQGKVMPGLVRRREAERRLFLMV